MTERNRSALAMTLFFLVAIAIIVLTAQHAFGRRYYRHYRHYHHRVEKVEKKADPPPKASEPSDSLAMVPLLQVKNWPYVGPVDPLPAAPAGKVEMQYLPDIFDSSARSSAHQWLGALTASFGAALVIYHLPRLFPRRRRRLVSTGESNQTETTLWR